ncbi:restriction endonuclease subunit S [Staphylococcus debuckii]|uniref:restriction endonuclease subunit S n=1 Tax=Staphylococcus debuckii TaxID=2044912 RepID=UPI003B8A7DEE
MGEVVKLLKGNNQDTDLPVMTISAKRGWLNQEERFSQVIAGNSLKKYTELRRGDLSYNKGNSKVAKYGIVYKLPIEKALVPNVYKSFRALDNVDENYLEKYFHSKILDKQLRTKITSTARMDGLLNISDNEFFNIILKLPFLNEQRKIGTFFEKLDQQIELEEKKLELLEDQKKSFLQKMYI